MSNETGVLEPGLARRPGASESGARTPSGRIGGARWMRWRLLGRRSVHAWPAGDARLVTALGAALGDGLPQEPEACDAPDGGILLVALDDPGAASLLVQLRSDERWRLLPIGLASSPEAAPRERVLADAVLPLGPASLLQGLLALEVLLERVEALPPTQGLSGVEARELDLVRYLHAHEIREIYPLPDPDSPVGFRYPLVEALLARPPLDTLQALDELHALGMLAREPCERMYLCAACQSSRLSFREVCPGCRLPSLEEQAVIHHFRCAHVGPAAEFRRDGALACPKCEMTLVHVGVDHDRPGVELRCSRCRTGWTEGIVESRCLACDARSSVDRQRVVDLPVYRARPALARAAARTVPPLTSASEMLRTTLHPTDPGVYAMLRGRAEATCRRYGRPASVIRMAVESLDALTDRVGRNEVHRRIAGLTQALLPLVRNTDAVGLGEGVIEVLLIETDLEGARVVEGRIARALAEQGESALAVTLTTERLGAAADP